MGHTQPQPLRCFSDCVTAPMSAQPLSRNSVPSCESAGGQRNRLGLHHAVKKNESVFLTVKKKKKIFSRHLHCPACISLNPKCLKQRQRAKAPNISWQQKQTWGMTASATRLRYGTFPESLCQR